MRLVLFFAIYFVSTFGCKQRSESQTASENQNSQACPTSSSTSFNYPDGQIEETQASLSKLLGEDTVIQEGDIIIPAAEVDQDNTLMLGDMIGSTWPNGVIPYEFGRDVSETQQPFVEAAIREWNSKTNVKFVKFHADFYKQKLKFLQKNSDDSKTDQGICAASVGYTSLFSNSVYMGPHCDAGTLIHELGHVLGLRHEQNRNDRDNFVEIKWENINPKSKSQFAKNTRLFSKPFGKYDFKSIMHYRSDEACIVRDNRCIGDTIVRKDGKALCPNSDSVSDLDIETINNFYPKKYDSDLFFVTDNSKPKLQTYSEAKESCKSSNYRIPDAKMIVNQFQIRKQYDDTVPSKSCIWLSDDGLPGSQKMVLQVDKKLYGNYYDYGYNMPRPPTIVPKNMKEKCYTSCVLF